MRHRRLAYFLGTQEKGLSSSCPLDLILRLAT